MKTPTTLSRKLRLARSGGTLRLGDQGYFFSRKRRLFVNLFRNKRRRLDRLWKHAEFASYLLERLLLVGPVQGRVVEALHDGGFDDFEIGRDVEVARHLERCITNVQDFAPGLSGAGARDLGQ